MKDIFFQQLNTKFEHLSMRVAAHDVRFDAIDEKLDFIAQAVAGHEGKFEKIDKHFLRINEHFDRIDAHFDKIDAHFDKIDSLLLSHEQRLSWIEENMVTKKEFRELMNTLDYSVKKVNDMKEDHVFGMEWMKRMQEQLGWHEQDIRKLKLMLNLA